MSSAIIGGRVSWLSPVAAALPALAYVFFITSFLKNRGEDEGLTHMFMRALGSRCGKAVALLFALWLTVYSGFVLRSAAERLLSAVYENGGSALFIVLTLAVVVIASLGELRHLARTAEVFLPILLGALILVTAFAAVDIKIENLLPVSYLDTGNILLGAIPILNVLCAFSYFAFLCGHTEKRTENPKITRRWVLVLLLCMFLIIAVSIGVLSSPLVVKLQNAFFIMVRNVTIFGIIERFEALVIMLWVITDFIYLAALLIIITEILKVSFNSERRRPFVWPVSGAVALSAFFAVSNAFELHMLSQWVVPAVNMFMIFVLLPAVYLVGKLRKRI